MIPIINIYHLSFHSYIYITINMNNVMQKLIKSYMISPLLSIKVSLGALAGKREVKNSHRVTEPGSNVPGSVY